MKVPRISRYIVPRVTGDAASEHYYWTDYSTGEIHCLKPEYATMSRRPGIARVWYDKFSDDLFPHDYVVLNGRKCPVPRYYDGLLQISRPYLFDAVKEARMDNIILHLDNNTEARLNVREECKLAQFSQLKRDKDFLNGTWCFFCL